MMSGVALIVQNKCLGQKLRPTVLIIPLTPSTKPAYITDKQSLKH